MCRSIRALTLNRALPCRPRAVTPCVNQSFSLTHRPYHTHATRNCLYAILAAIARALRDKVSIVKKLRCRIRAPCTPRILVRAQESTVLFHEPLPEAKQVQSDRGALVLCHRELNFTCGNRIRHPLSCVLSHGGVSVYVPGAYRFIPQSLSCELRRVTQLQHLCRQIRPAPLSGILDRRICLVLVDSRVPYERSIGIASRRSCSKSSFPRYPEHSMSRVRMRQMNQRPKSVALFS